MHATATKADSSHESVVTESTKSQPTANGSAQQSPLWAQTLLPLQAKLTINRPGDKYEQEADRVAEQVMRMSAPQVQCKTCSCGKPTGPDGMCEECKRKKLGIQRMASGDAPQTTAPSIVHQVLQQPGRPLESSTRNFMESRFGQDFGGVRVHAYGKSNASAEAVNAKAYTVGQHMVFGQGQYRPGTATGRKLLAHELTHVVQQNRVKSIQRKTHECENNPVNGEKLGLSCSISDPISLRPSEDISFNRNSSVLEAAARKQISHFSRSWINSGANTRIRIDGFASCDGPENLNWRLSCERANYLAQELISQGVGAEFISLIANGETNRFSATDLSANRKATISLHASRKPTPKPKAEPNLTESVLIWLNAFIPGTVPDGTKTISKGSFAGKTCIEAPIFGCALSDNRRFSKSRLAKTRMRLFILVDLKTLTFKFGGFSDYTHHIDLENGKLLCRKRAEGNYRVDGRIMSTNPNGLGMKFIASGSNPCATGAPDIDFMGIIGVDRKDRRIKVQALVDGFPAYEMYISSTKTGATSTIFTSVPECNDGRNVMCLFGGPRFERNGDVQF